MIPPRPAPVPTEADQEKAREIVQVEQAKCRNNGAGVRWGCINHIRPGEDVAGETLLVGIAQALAESREAATIAERVRRATFADRQATELDKITEDFDNMERRDSRDAEDYARHADTFRQQAKDSRKLAAAIRGGKS